MDLLRDRVAAARIRIFVAVAALVMIAALAFAAAMPTESRAATTTDATCMAMIPECMGLTAYCAWNPSDSRCGVTTAPLSYKGWAYLNLNYCPPGAVCAAIYRATTTAWRWTGSTWVRVHLQQGWVYAWPFSGEWRWAWSSATGWVAVRGERFEIRSY